MSQTLPDLVLNLITDNAFGSEFLADPTGVLSAAGLTDITGTDVSEVTSLIADQVPAPVADAVETGLASLPTDTLGVNDMSSAVAQLQTVAAVAQGVPDTAFGTLSGVTDTAGVSGTFDATTDGLTTGVLAGTPLGDVTGALAATADGALGTGVDSPLGTYGLSTDALSLPDFGSVSDLGSTLDAGALGAGNPMTDATADYAAQGADLAVSTVSNVTDYAAQGTDLASSTVSSVTGLAGDHVSTAAAGLGGTVAGAGEDVASHVNSVTSLATGVTSSLPVAVPVHLPADLPVHVVADLPQHLPAALPALPNVPDAVDTTVSHASSLTHATSLTDSVTHGGLLDTAHAAVPEVSDVTGGLLHGDLPLGH
ncbi:IniB N-terminal domain-containing protein [Amycolatopsis sp. GM8]|uniref:IniB N-terminal domain-containing protein n=1 Tax=Amycolatopsis sp. GM8 TaxID=2896530 RepID=UPI001F27A8EA|nr:IniB N-terminal domain-containing protein [Amycolatopsis sp. GM8]